jgi:hypothetical protein
MERGYEERPHEALNYCTPNELMWVFEGIELGKWTKRKSNRTPSSQFNLSLMIRFELKQISFQKILKYLLAIASVQIEQLNVKNGWVKIPENDMSIIT